MYLLNFDKIVILKDVSYEKLKDFLYHKLMLLIKLEMFPKNKIINTCIGKFWDAKGIIPRHPEVKYMSM